MQISVHTLHGHTVIYFQQRFQCAGESTRLARMIIVLSDQAEGYEVIQRVLVSHSVGPGATEQEHTHRNSVVTCRQRY